MKRFVFSKGNLGDLADQINTRAKKKSRQKKKKIKIHFSIFIGNQNLDLKFV